MNELPAWVVTMLRGGVQIAWGLVATWLAAHGLNLGVSNEFVVGVLVTVVITAVLGGLRWLETRQGETFWPRLARRVAAVAMFGLSRLQPVYVKPTDRVQVDGKTVQ